MQKFWLTTAKISALVIVWFAVLVAISVYVSRTPISPAFPYYQSDLSQYPQSLAVFTHFDGIHYLRIAQYGYKDVGTQAFFPLYPLLIRALSPIFPAPLYAGIFISLLSLIIALIGLRSLSPKILHSKYFILLLPTSFFFAAVYTESLFLAITVWFFVFLRRRLYLPAAILAGLASSARPIGIFLSLSLAYELFKSFRSQSDKQNTLYFILNTAVLLLVSASGMFIYSLYLQWRFADWLMFFHVQPLFGAERSGSSLILLPQVLYRYLKMIITVNPTTFVYQRIWLELLSFLGLTYLIIKNFRRLPVSQTLFVIPALLLPTLTGTLSSFPRYALVLLPFLLSASMSRNKWKIIYLFLSTFGLIYLFTIFASGTFVS